MIRKGKKCICKKCEDCNLYRTWDYESNDGLREMIDECLFVVLASEIPKLRRDVLGAERASEEARNRSMETKETMFNYAEATNACLKKIGRDFIAVIGNANNKLIQKKSD